MMSLWWLALTAGLISLAAPLIWLPFLRRINAVDVPNERSSHVIPTLRGAGLAPATGATAALLLVVATRDTDVLAIAILATGLALALLGITEDLRGISVRWRLILQLLIACTAGVLVCSFTDAEWWLVWGVALVIAAYVNVANFMDGINGISAFHGLIAGSHFAVLGATYNLRWLYLVGLIIAAIFLAFTPWNLINGGVFLGDVGSYLLGGLIATTGAAFYLSGGSAVLAVAPALPYIVDTGFTFVLRALRGERLTHAHRSHIYQQLTQAGLSHPVAAGLVATVTVACCLVAHMWHRGTIQSPIAVLLMAGLIGGYVAAPFFIRRAVAFPKHP